MYFTSEGSILINLLIINGTAVNTFFCSERVEIFQAPIQEELFMWLSHIT